MKKFLVVLLALLMCLSVVACDSKKKKSDDDDDDDDDKKEASESTVTASSDVDSAVKTAIEVFFGDNNRKAEDLWPVALECNLDIIELVTDEEEAEELKTTILNNRDRITETIRINHEDNPLGEAKNVKFEYKILYSDIYDNNTSKFEQVVNSRFPSENPEIKAKIEKVASVEVWMSYSGTENGEPVRDSDQETVYCFKINGKWYVSVR